MDLKRKKCSEDDLTRIVHTARSILPTLLMRFDIYNKTDQKKAIDLSVELAHQLIEKCKE